MNSIYRHFQRITTHTHTYTNSRNGENEFPEYQKKNCNNTFDVQIATVFNHHHHHHQTENFFHFDFFNSQEPKREREREEKILHTGKSSHTLF